MAGHHPRLMKDTGAQHWLAGRQQEGWDTKPLCAFAQEPAYPTRQGRPATNSPPPNPPTLVTQGGGGRRQVGGMHEACSCLLVNAGQRQS
jgi:hypothetical protein